MTPTMYAAFDDAAGAEKAAVALLERGLRAQDISLVLNEDRRREREDGTSTPEIEDELNPAQNDYPRTESDSPTELSSAPPNAARMYNTGLETESYNHPYSAEVQKEIERDAAMDRERQRMTSQPLESVHSSEVPQTDDHTILEDAGIETPAIVDPKTTVAASAGLGIGVGALAAMAAITIPGYGLVLGGGALATAVAGLAASSKKGVVADGIVGWLKDQGVPADAIDPLRLAYESGGAILAVALDKSPADSVELESVLRSRGATQVGAYGYAA